MSFDGLKKDNLHFLNQGLELLNAIDDRLFTSQPQLPMSPVGGHFRHCIDFYGSFLSGLDHGDIDYDARPRDPRLEVDREYAAGRMAELMERLRQLSDAEHRPLRVSMDTGCESDGPCWAASSVERELQFLRSHTVHHYALISALLRLLGHEPSIDFGVAPATLAHRRQLVRS